MITSEFDITPYVFVKVAVGVTSAFIQNVYGGSVYVVVASSQPSSNKLGHILKVGEYLPFTNADLGIWVRSIESNATIITTE